MSAEPSSTTIPSDSAKVIELEPRKELESPPAAPQSSTGVRLPSELAPRKWSWRYQLISTAILFAALGGLWYSYDYWKPRLDAFVRPNATAKPKPRPPLVALAVVKAESVAQYINCVGTVSAFNNVVVKSRVEGELMEVAFVEGQLVEQGQLLARIDPRPFEAMRDQAKGQLERDQASLSLSKLTFDRMKLLSVRDAASQQEVDEAAAAMRQTEALVNVDRASLANAELQLSYSTISAPIRGRVGLRMLDRGNMVRANEIAGIAVITQLQPISVVFAIPQDEIPAVRRRLNEAGSIEVLAYDRSFKELIATGTLTAVDNQVDASTGTLKLKAKFENENETLFPNQFVNVRLLVKQWDDAIVVPSTAIQRGPDFSFVYVASETETVDIRKVEVVFSDAGKTVLQSGVTPGEKVVVEGTDKLQPGGKVTLPGSKPPGDGKPTNGKPTEGRPSDSKPSDSRPSDSKR